MTPITRALAALLSTLSLSLPAVAQDDGPFDLSPEQSGREHARPNPAAIAAIPRGFAFVTPGTLTIGSNPSSPPLAAYATDTATVVAPIPTSPF